MLKIYQDKFHFKLQVLGFEFEQSEFQEDLSWVIVKIEASDPAIGSWDATGPYLRVNEIQQLSQWLRALGESSATEHQLDFLENELAFKYDNEFSILTVLLDFSFHPKGINYDYGKDQEYGMKFQLTNTKLLALAQQVDQLLPQENLHR